MTTNHLPGNKGPTQLARSLFSEAIMRRRFRSRLLVDDGPAQSAPGSRRIRWGGGPPPVLIDPAEEPDRHPYDAVQP